MAFQLVYLHLILAISKVQAHFDCEYLTNGDT